MNQPVLQLEGLQKRFGDKIVVDRLELALERGMIHGLLGRNGAGKTTTLRMVMGIFFPEAGTIKLFDTPWHPGLLERVGYMPEERGMYKSMRLRDNLRFFCALKGQNGNNVEARLEEFLRRFDLWGMRDEPVETLSKGNQQKAQLAGVLAFDPELIILDEPLSGLDPVNVILVREILGELKAAGKTILLSTHLMDEAERLCDTITLIHRGRTVLTGPLDRIRREFGGAQVSIEFSGAGSFLKELPFVRQAEVEPNRAKLILKSGCTPEQVLQAIVGRLEIRRFDTGTATLEDIFIRMAGAAADAEGA